MPVGRMQLMCFENLAVAMHHETHSPRMWHCQTSLLLTGRFSTGILNDTTAVQLHINGMVTLVMTAT